MTRKTSCIAPVFGALHVYSNLNYWMIFNFFNQVPRKLILRIGYRLFARRNALGSERRPAHVLDPQLSRNVHFPRPPTAHCVLVTRRLKAHVRWSAVAHGT